MGAPSTSTATEKATRDGYGDALHELGVSRSDVVVLDADLSGSTKQISLQKLFRIVFLM